MKKYRIIALIMMIVTFSPLLFSCGKQEVAGTGSNDTRTVMTIDGKDVTYDEFRYFYLNFKRDMDGGDADYWTEHPEAEDELMETVILTLTSNYAVYHIADELGIALDDTEASGVADEMEYTVKSYGGDEQYRAALDEYFMTGDVYKSIVELNMLEAKVRPEVTDEFAGIVISDDATVEADIRENFIRVKHILIMNDDGDDIAANRALADELHERAASGEDFETLIRDYSEDADMDVDSGYYFTRGEFLESFEDAAYALEIGELSSVVESVNGYHIIKRYEQDDAYIDANFSELRDIYKTRCFNEYRDNIADSLDIEYTELYGTLNISTVV
ncbi:MAG: peptidylprolyl isomerase [Eubacteriales bacterium]